MLQLKQRVYRQVRSFNPNNPSADLFAIGEVVEITQRVGYPPNSFKVNWLNQLGRGHFGCSSLLTETNVGICFFGYSSTFCYKTSDEAARAFESGNKASIRNKLCGLENNLRAARDNWKHRQKEIEAEMDRLEKKRDALDDQIDEWSNQLDKEEDAFFNKEAALEDEIDALKKQLA